MKKAKSLFWLQASIAVIFTGIVAFSVVPSMAQDIKSNENDSWLAQGPSGPVTPQAAMAVSKNIGKTILVPVGAFTTDGFSAVYRKNFLGGYMYGTDAALSACLVAPIIFPKGAKQIVNAYGYAWDSNASINAFFAVDRINPATGEVTRLGTVSTADSSSIYQYEIPISDVKVTEDYVYQIATCFYGSIYVYGAKVAYK